MTTFLLREIRDSDHHFLIDLHNDEDVLRNLTNPNPITIDQHMKWWESIKNNLNEKRFIYCINDKPVGIAKIYNIDYTNKNCVLGADIHKNFRGKGYAKNLWRLMVRYCFDELKLERISLTSAEFNYIAHRVYKSLGFEEEGRLIKSLYRNNQFYDQICMYLLKDEWNKRWKL